MASISFSFSASERKNNSNDATSTRLSAVHRATRNPSLSEIPHPPKDTPEESCPPLFSLGTELSMWWEPFEVRLGESVPIPPLPSHRAKSSGTPRIALSPNTDRAGLGLQKARDALRKGERRSPPRAVLGFIPTLSSQTRPAAPGPRICTCSRSSVPC